VYGYLYSLSGVMVSIYLNLSLDHGQFLISDCVFNVCLINQLHENKKQNMKNRINTAVQRALLSYLTE